MRIVITGASGNVGTALVRRLCAERGHELVGVVRRPPGQGPRGVTWRAADLARPSSAEVLARACAGADAVVHLAWGFQPSHRPDLLGALGVGGTRRVIEAVVASGVPHLVHMSSVGAYSAKVDDAPVDESYPTDGIEASPYSRHKAAAERLLDDLVAGHPETTVSRLRPGIIGQGEAGSSLLRYGVPGVVPAGVLRLLPVLPLDRSALIPMVHADDVADAVVRILERGVGGPFNLAAEPHLTADDIAAALGARHVHLPAPVLRAAVSGAWHARLLQLDPGWIDLAFSVPVLDTARARRELGWVPTRSATEVLAETVQGVVGRGHAPTPVLRRRSVAGAVADSLRHGVVGSRSLP